MDGHIKLYRKFLDWEWYQDINTKVLFIHMLLKANWKDGKFMGTTIPRGSFVSSIKNLASETGLTEREIRTGISHLKTTGEVTSKATNKYSVFTITNYDLYQSDDRQEDTQATGERHSNDKRTTTIEERKKEIIYIVHPATGSSRHLPCLKPCGSCTHTRRGRDRYPIPRSRSS